MTGIDADHGVLQGIQSKLHDAHAGLEGLAGSLPQPGDVGDLGGPLAELLGTLTHNAGQLSTALAALSSAVGQADTQYRNDDDAGAQAFSSMFGGGGS